VKECTGFKWQYSNLELNKFTFTDWHWNRTSDNLIVPVKKNIIFLITSSDVLHSWAVTCFGVKVDACPGRLNRLSLSAARPGYFLGQCSELCGVNHALMPIQMLACNYVTA